MTPTAASSGPATATTCACSSGWSSGFAERGGPTRRRSGSSRRRARSTPAASTCTPGRAPRGAPLRRRRVAPGARRARRVQQAVRPAATAADRRHARADAPPLRRLTARRGPRPRGRTLAARDPLNDPANLAAIEGLAQSRHPRLLEERLDLRAQHVAGHQDEAPTELGEPPLQRAIEPGPVEVRHPHVAQDQIVGASGAAARAPACRRRRYRPCGGPRRASRRAAGARAARRRRRECVCR